MRSLSFRFCVLAVIALSAMGVPLGGCAPNPSAAALPPATVFGPERPKAEAAAKPVTANQPAPATVASPTSAPAAEGSTALPPTRAASPLPNNPAVPRKPVQVTILHTNDVFGEIDPCG